MKEFNLYITEKLKINKNTHIDNKEEKEFVYDILTLCGIKSDLDFFYKELSNRFYELDICEENMGIYCDSSLTLFNRYKEVNIVKVSPDSVKYFDTITFDKDYINSLNLNATLICNKYPFKILFIKKGLVIKYQKYDEKYTIYITKKNDRF